MSDSSLSTWHGAGGARPDWVREFASYHDVRLADGDAGEMAPPFSIPLPLSVRFGQGGAMRLRRLSRVARTAQLVVGGQISLETLERALADLATGDLADGSGVA